MLLIWIICIVIAIILISLIFVKPKKCVRWRDQETNKPIASVRTIENRAEKNTIQDIGLLPPIEMPISDTSEEMDMQHITDIGDADTLRLQLKPPQTSLIQRRSKIMTLR
jgi:hypothetical protein